MYVTFESPFYLWLLLAVPILIYSHFYWLKHSKRKALKFANFIAIKRISGKKLMTRNYTQLIIRITLLISLIFAISIPILWYETDVNEFDFVISIDASASMAAQDFSPSRLELAKETAAFFVDDIKSKTKIGVISFSGTTFIHEPISENKIEVIKSIGDIKLIKAGGTDIPGTIITSTNLLIPSSKGKGVILLTDGSSTTGSLIDDALEQSIDYAKERNVKVFALGIGSESGPVGYLPEFYNITSVYNESVLIKISEETGGNFFKVENKEDMENAFAEIGENSNRATTDFNTSLPLAALALFLLFLEWSLANTKFRRLP